MAGRRGRRTSRSRLTARLPLGLGVIAIAALASACYSVSPTAYLSVNRQPAPLADGMSLPATAASGSASAAASAKPVPLTGGTLVLPEDSTVTLDLTGSWLAWNRLDYTDRGKVWEPIVRASQWACPTGTWAYFGKVFWGGSSAAALDDAYANFVEPLQLFGLQAPAWDKPFTYGAQCASAYDGKTLTITTPLRILNDAGPWYTYLYVTTTSSALQSSTYTLADGKTVEVGTFTPIQTASWFKVELTAKAAPAAAASTAPTARLIARATPAATSGAMGEYLWRQVDARTSTDPRGSALTYTWDLNGDGVYGDQPATVDASVTVPTGVAIVPDSVLTPLIAGSGTQTVGVKVTNASGESSTATTTLRPVAWNTQSTSRVEFSTDTPVAGAAVTASFVSQNHNIAIACVDYDGDGAYESNVTLYGYGTQTATFNALAAGAHVVTTAFAGNAADCTANPFSVYRAVYVATAAGARSLASSSRAGDYAAATRMTLLDGRTLREPSKAAKITRLDGAVFGGRYRWAVPARGNGKARPAALAAFARGPYAALASQMTLVGGAANQVGVGSGYMLLRGVDEGDLLCLRITSPGPLQRTLILGGTGAGAKLRGSLTGNSLKMPFDALGLVGVTRSGKSLKPEFGQVEPFSNTARLTASTGAARALPKACRGLVRHLPAADDDGSSTPSVVTG